MSTSWSQQGEGVMVVRVEGALVEEAMAAVATAKNACMTSKRYANAEHR